MLNPRAKGASAHPREPMPPVRSSRISASGLAYRVAGRLVRTGTTQPSAWRSSASTSRRNGEVVPIACATQRNSIAAFFFSPCAMR